LIFQFIGWPANVIIIIYWYSLFNIVLMTYWLIQLTIPFHSILTWCIIYCVSLSISLIHSFDDDDDDDDQSIFILIPLSIDTISLLLLMTHSIPLCHYSGICCVLVHSWYFLFDDSFVIDISLVFICWCDILMTIFDIVIFIFFFFLFSIFDISDIYIHCRWLFYSVMPIPMMMTYFHWRVDIPLLCVLHCCVFDDQYCWLFFHCWYSIIIDDPIYCYLLMMILSSIDIQYYWLLLFDIDWIIPIIIGDILNDQY